jgi:diadenosine tetraphosphate (Ap4A) HIT family hydrolase
MHVHLHVVASKSGVVVPRQFAEVKWQEIDDPSAALS